MTRTYGDLPAKNTVYTPYICLVLANPTHSHPCGSCEKHKKMELIILDVKTPESVLRA
jgi:hypothetical protein